jgi:hypothetical protein
MTPEQNLWCGVVDRAVQDSLEDPTKEYDHMDARNCLMTDYMEGIYMLAHNRSIAALRELLQVIWDKIDKNPQEAKEYRRVFMTANGREARGGRHDLRWLQ